MSDGDSSDKDRGAPRRWAEGGPERLYVVTGGRNRPAERVALDLVALIVARGAPGPGAHPEQAAILRMCTNPLSVAEISAYLSLPASMVSVLVGDLIDGGQVEVRAPASAAALPQAAVLEAVIDGLSRI
ncbi:DUF742 domain-containing protein [Actinomadura rudentiformis]|uniref:DUF742 domain-containing protein n=1 Tax=Actinomadura rudentiformis TaxID=359158 RepID=A0A6H9Z2Q9_9ACTN|nr:DUF742 domain-containing protein [Actinomadura rudentiformis]KAB2352332.1 DUF742 domain-containing protein [Actinomadura rudentiformis]